MKRLFAVLICGTFFSSPVWAVDLTLGLNTYYFDYREDVAFPLKSTEAATIYAAYARAKFPIDAERIYWTIEGELSPSIKSNYDGSTQKGVPVETNNIQTLGRAELQAYFQIHPMIHAYAGFGYRYWNRFLNGGSGYREIYTWTYAPVGVLFEMPLSPDVTWGIDLSYRMMLNGQIQVIFSETVENGDDTTLNLKNRNGFKIQVPLKMALGGPQFTLLISPWYEYSEIGGSDFKYNSTPVQDDPFSSPHALGPIREPDSRTSQYGAVVGASFSF